MHEFLVTFGVESLRCPKIDHPKKLPTVPQINNGCYIDFEGFAGNEHQAYPPPILIGVWNQNSDGLFRQYVFTEAYRWAAQDSGVDHEVIFVKERRSFLEALDLVMNGQIDSTLLIKKINELFSVLREEDIFAIDIDGGGWAPNDNGDEIVSEKFNVEVFRNNWPEKNKSACWTDTNWYVNEIGPGFSSANIYYCTLFDHSYSDSYYEENGLRIAKKIVEKAEQIGLKVSWGGTTGGAIGVALREGG